MTPRHQGSSVRCLETLQQRETHPKVLLEGGKKKKKPDLLWLFSLYLLNNPQQYVHVETFTVFFINYQT